MSRRVRELLLLGGVALGTLVAFLGATYLHYGSAWSDLRVLPTFVVATVLGFLVVSPMLGRRGRIAGLLVALGVVGFVVGVTASGAACNDAGYPPDATHGIAYEGIGGEVRFGDHTENADYRCRANPREGVAFGGYLLSTTGGLLAVRSGGRRDGG